MPTAKQLAANRSNAKLRRGITCTYSIVDSIAEKIAEGVRPEIAAVLSGVPSRTFFRWMHEARQENPRPVLAALRDAVEVSLAQWEKADVERIRESSRKDSEGQWQAAAWMLERRLPSIYARRTKVESDVTVTARPFIDTTKLTVPQRELLLDLLKLAAPDSPEELPADAKPALELMPGDTAAA